MASNEIEQWPAMRGRTLREIVRGVLVKGPLLGLGISVVLIGMTALMRHEFAGDTLEFGWFLVPGQPGAPAFTVHTHFFTFLPWAVIASSTFFLLLGAGIWVTLETQFHRFEKSAGRDGHS